jgi:hypothetical protein
MMEIIDTNLEQKVSKILTLIQQYQVINQYGELLKEVQRITREAKETQALYRRNVVVLYKTTK